MAQKVETLAADSLRFKTLQAIVNSVTFSETRFDWQWTTVYGIMKTGWNEERFL